MRIKQLISLTEPTATVILFGSQARGQSNNKNIKKEGVLL